MCVSLINKKYFLVIVCLIVSATLINIKAQNIENYAIELTDNFERDLGRLTFDAKNNDYCDYYLYITFSYAEGFQGMQTGKSVVVNPGYQTIMNYKVKDDAQRVGYNYRYAMYRGNPNKKTNIDFTYALPIHEGENVEAGTTANSGEYQLSMVLSSDTAFACRGGIVCNDDLKDNTAKGYKYFSDNQTQSQITIYHDDGTFGEYIFRGMPLVYPGKRVQMGDPLAFVDEIGGKYTILFSTYFLDKSKVNDKYIGNKHTHFRPFFQSYNHGKQRLERDKNYMSEITDEMLMQDMSNKEKKKFLKEKK